MSISRPMAVTDLPGSFTWSFTETLLVMSLFLLPKREGTPFPTYVWAVSDPKFDKILVRAMNESSANSWGYSSDHEGTRRQRRTRRANAQQRARAENKAKEKEGSTSVGTSEIR